MTAEGANPLVVCCDPVDGSSNLDVNGSVGTIFSLRPSRGRVPAGPAALGPGTDQVAAGYVMYGPATTLVYTAGHGTHGFTLEPRDRRVRADPSRHPHQAPRQDLRHQRGQSPLVAPGAARLRRVLAHARQGKWPPLFASLLRRHGGRRAPDPARRRACSCTPRTTRDPAKPKPKLRLLYEVAPMAMLVEQAGGRASTGTQRVMDVAGHRVPPARGDHHRQPRRRGTGRGLLPPAGLTSACRPRKDDTMGTRVKEILSWYASENPGVRTNLARMLNHGTPRRHRPDGHPARGPGLRARPRAELRGEPGRL